MAVIWPNIPSSIESGCVANLAGALPQYNRSNRKCKRAASDLLPIMRAYVYHLEFRGSYSLKSVLPALVPDMSYDGMEVAEGNEAGLAWEKMIHAEAGSAERKRLEDALRAYCKQDTLAMVRVVAVLAAA